MTSIEILRQLLAQLREADTKLTIFGSEVHRYQLNPCLTENEVQAFEHQCNVTLPDDYRQFLLEVGNGGVGPGYGMLKLIGKDYAAESDACKELIESFAQPFPYQYAISYMRNNEEINDGGYFAIADYGCSLTALLVVAGNQRGKVWFAGEGEMYPFGQGLANIFHAETNEDVGAEKAFSFFEWYHHWLISSLAEIGVTSN